MNKENDTKLTATRTEYSIFNELKYTQICVYGQKCKNEVTENEEEFHLRIFDPLVDQIYTFLINHDKHYILITSYFTPGVTNRIIVQTQSRYLYCMSDCVHYNGSFADGIILEPYSMGFMAILPKDLHEQRFILNDVSHNKDFCKQKFDLLRDAGVDVNLINKIQDYQFGVVSQLLP